MRAADGDGLEYLIKQYPLESGALEIQYIEEYFGEFPRKKSAREILKRLGNREFLILMAEAPLPDDPGMVVPVSYKIVHEVRAEEEEPKLADLVTRLGNSVRFAGRKVLYSWIGGTRRDWRGQGHFRALTEESEAWAHASGVPAPPNPATLGAEMVVTTAGLAYTTFPVPYVWWRTWHDVVCSMAAVGRPRWGQRTVSVFVADRVPPFEGRAFELPRGAAKAFMDHAVQQDAVTPRTPT